MKKKIGATLLGIGLEATAFVWILALANTMEPKADQTSLIVASLIVWAFLSVTIWGGVLLVL